MDKSFVIVCILMVSVIISGGCIGTERNDTSNNTTHNNTDFLPKSDEVTSVNNSSDYHKAGLPLIRGVNDGSEIELQNRVIWLNATNKSSDTSVVTANLTTIEARDDEAQRLSIVIEEILTRTLRGDNRLEPNEQSESFSDGYTTLRKYFADALLLTTNDGERLQQLEIIFRGRRYRVKIGGRWNGGPTIDSTDPIHAIVAPEIGPNATVTVYHEDDIVHEEAMNLVNQHNEIYDISKPGNYSVTITAEPEKYNTSFYVPLIRIADCNPSSTNLNLNDTRMEATTISTTKGCMDPADRSPR